jgi:OOP family OmpA-OmpF porin
MKPIEISVTDLPRNVSIGFDFNKSAVNGNAQESLSPIIAWLKTDLGHHAKVVGYTDSTGSSAYNLKLSERRAQAVRQYLIQNGVRAEKVSALGMGESHPIAANDTDAGKERNRRVEIIPSGGVNTASIQ